MSKNKLNVAIDGKIHREAKIFCAKNTKPDGKQQPLGEYVEFVLETAIRSKILPTNGGKVKFQIINS